MQSPDRPRADAGSDRAEMQRSGWDNPARSDGLAERLTRLAAAHPSAETAADPGRYRRNPEGLDPDELALDGGDAADADAGDADAGGVDRDELSPDELGPDELGTYEPSPDELGPDKAAAEGSWPHRGADSHPWLGPSGGDRGAYRPWFSADSASDPWFAEPTDWAGPESGRPLTGHP